MVSVKSSQFERITRQLYKKNLELVSVNKELALLQKLYEIMMKTYEAQDVAQQFIDVIIKDLGFLSGLVALKHPSTDHLQAIGLSHAKATLAAIKIPLSGLQVSLSSKDNLLVRAFRKRRRLVSHDLREVVVPAVPEELVENISGLTQVKSTVIYPLIFGKRTLGVFTISLAREAKDLRTFEKEIMKRVAIVFGVAMDRVLLYQDLRTANAKLKILDKRKDEFLSVAAHELRAPMTAIKGYTSMILEGDAGEISAEAKDYLLETMEGNERLIRLVNNMLNVSRIEEGRLVYQMGTVYLTKVVKTVFDEFKVEAEDKNLQFNLEVADNIADQVYVDQDRIHEVLANLVSNAIKYTDQGSVTVKLRQPKIGTVRFEVTDTGGGISDEEKKKLFKKFSRLDSSAGKKIGTGLGLYISKLLIEKFGGQIGVDSELGQGSTFWFELPVCNK